MKIDLHTHSYYSDGVLSPTQLVQRALAQQVEMLALTDHDTLLGIAEAQQAAHEQPIRIIPGVEVSCTWQAQTIHVVGLNVAVTHPELQAQLAAVFTMRQERADSITKKLTQFGIPGIEESLARQVKGVCGRLHFARYLAQKGYVRSAGKAFQRFLTRGKTGYTAVQWMSLEAAVTLIRNAGGLPIIAHPRRYHLTMKQITRLCEDFKQAGGEGLEVATTTQNKSDQLLLASLAKHLDLALSIGSDFHEPCAYNEVGKASFLIPVNGRLISELL